MGPVVTISLQASMLMLRQNLLDSVLKWMLTSSSGLTGSNTSTDIRDTTSLSTRTLTHPRTTLTSTDIHLVMVPTPTSEPRDQISETLVLLTSQLEDTELVEEEVSTTSTLVTAPLRPTESSLDQARSSSRPPFLTQLIKSRHSSQRCSPTTSEHMFMVKTWFSPS